MPWLWTVALILAVGFLQEPRTVKGIYRHPGQGFSVVIPDAARGLVEGDLHTERGIRIALPSGGSIFVYGEPNTLEWPTPADGIRSAVQDTPKCASDGVREVRVGKLTGAGARLLCDGKVVSLQLVFRPGGGPVYWLRLETNRDNEGGDVTFLKMVSSSFQLIHWQ